MATISFSGVRPYDNAGIRKRTIGTLTGPVLYAAGGFSFTAAEVKMGVIEKLTLEPFVNATPVCLITKYNYATNMVQVFDMAGAESGAVDLSGYTARFEAVGTA